jgi:type IV secretion system protein VirB8
VRSVSPLGGNAALVRFETQRRDAGGQALPPHYWVAVIRYQFSTGALSMEDRYLNPLGFQVVRYRRDAESAPTTTDAEPPMTTTPAIVVPGAVQVVPLPTPAATHGVPLQGTTPPRPAPRSGPEVQL